MAHDTHTPNLPADRLATLLAARETVARMLAPETAETTYNGPERRTHPTK